MNKLIRILWIEDEIAYIPLFEKDENKYLPIEQDDNGNLVEAEIAYYYFKTEEDFLNNTSIAKINSFDYLIIDYSLMRGSNYNATDLIKKLKENDQEIKSKIVLISGSMLSGRILYDFINEGIKGFFYKDDLFANQSFEKGVTEIIQTIYYEEDWVFSKTPFKVYFKYLQEGGRPIVFEETELQVITLIGRGYTNKEIAAILNKLNSTEYKFRKVENIINRLILKIEELYIKDIEDKYNKNTKYSLRVRRDNLPLLAIAFNKIRSELVLKQ